MNIQRVQLPFIYKTELVSKEVKENILQWKLGYTLSR